MKLVFRSVLVFIVMLFMGTASYAQGTVNVTVSGVGGTISNTSQSIFSAAEFVDVLSAAFDGSIALDSTTITINNPDGTSATYNLDDPILNGGTESNQSISGIIIIAVVNLLDSIDLLPDPDNPDDDTDWLADFGVLVVNQIAAYCDGQGNGNGVIDTPEESQCFNSRVSKLILDVLDTIGEPSTPQ